MRKISAYSLGIVAGFFDHIGYLRVRNVIMDIAVRLHSSAIDGFDDCSDHLYFHH